jgi:hypothetical protein
MAASFKTFVVSWNDAADMKLRQGRPKTFYSVLPLDDPRIESGGEESNLGFSLGMV